MSDHAETIPDSEAVPFSLVEIGPILRAADEVELSNPRVAHLCRFYAFEKAHKLDPKASGRGVHRFRTALLRRLEKEDETTRRAMTRRSDAREMQEFYSDYFEKYIQAMKIAADKADRGHLTKAYQTAAVLFEVLKAVNPTAEPDPEEILEAQTKAEEETEICVPYSKTQIQAAVSALRNSEGDKKKENEEILDWLQAMFGFQKGNVDVALAEWTRVGVALAERASTSAQPSQSAAPVPAAAMPPPPPPLYRCPRPAESSWSYLFELGEVDPS